MPPAPENLIINHLPGNPTDGHDCDLHFTGEEDGAQRGEVTGPRSHSLGTSQLAF